MLLTLSANSLRALLAKGRAGKAKLDLLDLPTMAREELGLHGLSLSTEHLAGQPRDRYDRLRERADKAGCACLLLIESEPQALGDAKEDVGRAAVDRLTRVIQAGSILGCNAIAVRAMGADDPGVFQRTVDRMKKAVEKAERLEINVLIWPSEGLTSSADRVTEIIKKVGGFRVGTLPDFETASKMPDPVGYLRRITPYASAVIAATEKFAGPKGKKLDDGAAVTAEGLEHGPYDLTPLVESIMSVGYDASLSIEYRGSGDPKLGVLRSRAALERLLGLEEVDDDDLADLDIEGEEEGEQATREGEEPGAEGGGEAT
jgi:sugar phosphate isomerase/epimerase